MKRVSSTPILWTKNGTGGEKCFLSRPKFLHMCLKFGIIVVIVPSHDKKQEAYCFTFFKITLKKCADVGSPNWRRPAYEFNAFQKTGMLPDDHQPARRGEFFAEHAHEADAVFPVMAASARPTCPPSLQSAPPLRPAVLPVIVTPSIPLCWPRACPASLKDADAPLDLNVI